MQTGERPALEELLATSSLDWRSSRSLLLLRMTPILLRLGERGFLASLLSLLRRLTLARAREVSRHSLMTTD